MRLLQFGEAGFFETLGAFVEGGTGSRDEVVSTVAAILADVRARGDQAVIDYTQRFEGHRITAADFRVPTDDLAAAAAAMSASERERILEAIACVRSFHEKGMPRSWTDTNPHGARVGERWYPVQRVGIYIPAGSVPLVSTAVMTTTLAFLAGVPEVAVFTPAAADNRVSPQMLAGLHLCGVREVYRIGGAQAVAAMAFGTATIPKVLKVMGPGNAYVTEAQRQVFGAVGVELLPGPSEALAIADESAHPEYLAADLLAQAEHGTGREKIYYVYTSPTQAREVEAAIERQLSALSHAAAIRRVLDNGTVFIQVANMDEAIEVANFVAPEHLELHVRDEAIDGLVERITTAGAFLCGHDTPTVLGDFTAGPSHTLPTGGTGRFFSGLKITDFMRRSSIVRYDRASLARARAVVSVFSRLEHLDAHGRSIEVRFNASPDSRS